MEKARQLEEIIREFKERLGMLNDNSWAVFYLYKKSRKKKKYPEAFLYFFYSFELALKHMIMTEMMVKNSMKFIEDKEGLFSIYSPNEIKGILKIGKISKLIETFCLLFGDKIKDDLELINRERNFIIHNMMKEKLNEKRVEESFKYFFERSKYAIMRYCLFFDEALAGRPQKIIDKFKEKLGELN